MWVRHCGGHPRWVTTPWMIVLLLALSVGTAGCNAEPREDATQTPSPSSGSVSPSTPTTSGTSAPGRVPEGTWAGEELILTVTEAGASAEFECAAGLLAEPLELDAKSRFNSPGTYAAQSGGPVPATPPPAQSARYTGQLVDASHLVLTVLLPESGTTHGPFRLELGREPTLERCL